MNATLFLNAKAKLGEGSIWSTDNQQLYWVDIEGKSFNVLDVITADNKVYPLNKKPGTVVPIDAEHVLVAVEDGLITINLASGAIEYKLNTDIHLTNNKRFNDGKCDPSGRFWVGTLSMNGVSKVSSLYRISKDLDLEEKITGVSISNGIIWNIDGTLMYYIDTPTGEVVQYDFDLEDGTITNKKLIVKIPEEMGYPDGMTIDNEGMLWIALWDGFGVVRCNPNTGELLEKVNVAAPKVTSCAFGGPNLDKLFITTASVEMTEADLAEYPLSGGIFTADVNAKGVPAHKLNV